MGGPRVTPASEKFLVQTYQMLRSKENPNPSAKEVLAAAEALIKKRGVKHIFLPKVRKTQQILARLQQNERNLPPNQSALQEPWSMATLDTHPLPSTSLPTVMHVWRYTFVTGETFTIRQAKWVSRLQGFGPDPRIPDNALIQWLQAREYANKEEAAILSGIPFDSLDNDLKLPLTPLEIGTIWKIRYGEEPFPDPFSTYIPYSDDKSIMHEVVHPLDYYNSLYNGAVSNKRDKEFHRLLSSSPSLRSLGLKSLEIWMVYLIWVTHLKQQPQWPNLSARQATQLTINLREWAVGLQSMKYDEQQPKPPTVITHADNAHLSIAPEFPTPKHVFNLLAEYAHERGA